MTTIAAGSTHPDFDFHRLKNWYRRGSVAAEDVPEPPPMPPEVVRRWWWDVDALFAAGRMELRDWRVAYVFRDMAARHEALFPTLEVLAKKARVKATSLRGSLKRLAALGLLRWTMRRLGARQTSNLYELLIPGRDRSETVGRSQESPVHSESPLTPLGRGLDRLKWLISGRGFGKETSAERQIRLLNEAAERERQRKDASVQQTLLPLLSAEEVARRQRARVYDKWIADRRSRR